LSWRYVERPILSLKGHFATESPAGNDPIR
jgi:hypothetical protein